MTTATASLLRLLESLGFCEMRCRACLSPYFASDLDHPDSMPTLRLCPSCQKALAAYQGPLCRLCGLPDASGLCRHCRSQAPLWSGVALHGLYDGALRDLILRLKFGGELQISWLLAEFLYEAAKCLPRPDAIVAIPQFPAHLRKRGFNQAYEISRQLAKSTGFKLTPAMLLRIREGLPQEGLSAQERKLNLENAFKASSAAAGKTIWLVDDVVTTGSTCAAATRELLLAGARAVYLLFVARTV